MLPLTCSVAHNPAAAVSDDYCTVQYIIFAEVKTECAYLVNIGLLSCWFAVDVVLYNSCGAHSEDEQRRKDCQFSAFQYCERRMVNDDTHGESRAPLLRRWVLLSCKSQTVQDSLCLAIFAMTLQILSGQYLFVAILVALELGLLAVLDYRDWVRQQVSPRELTRVL